MASAALAASQWVGRGDPLGADGASVDALRAGLAQAPCRGTVVIGEGARDRAPELPPGERVGRWGPDDPAVDVALDPVECTRACAEGRPGALVAVAVGPAGSLLAAPDLRMDKRAVGPAARGCVDIRRPLADDLTRVAHAIGRPVGALRVAMLDRPRNDGHLEVLASCGIAPVLLLDGDLDPAIRVGLGDFDLLVGIGGAPEGVLSAVALRALGGELVGRLLAEPARDLDARELDARELVDGAAWLVVAGVTDGPLLARPVGGRVDVRWFG